MNLNKKENAFTLAELLATIVILGIIALIIFPVVNKSVKDSKQKLYEEQKNILIRGAKNYLLENTDQYSKTGNTYIDIAQLKKEGYIEKKEVINPITKKEMNGCIVVSYNTEYKQYKYEYTETSCDELKTIPIITLNGESSITIGLNETYTDPGYTAKAYDGTDITSSIVVTGTVDTSKEGTYYIKYNVTYNGKNAKEVIRTVKVIDKSPIIILKGEKNITIGLNETYTDPGYTAKTYDGTDITSSVVTTGTVNTATAGNYTIKYNATYDGKNAKEVTRTVTVVDTRPTIALNQTSTTEYQQSVTIAVTVTPYTDNTISSIKYKLDGGTEQTVTNNQIVIDTTGTHTLEIIVTDNKGNTNTLTAGPYYVDANKPTIELAVSGSPFSDDGWSKENITLDVTTNDTGGSNIKEYLYCYGNNCTPSTTKSGNTITISDEGTNNYVCAIAIDNAGNKSEKTCVGPYKIDKTVPSEPTLASTTTANTNGWYKEDINITTSTDTNGIKKIKYCKTTSTSCSPDTTISGTSGSITIDTENETNYVCALTVDKAGNQSETKCSGPYALDKTAPTLTIPADTSIPTTEATTYDILDGVSATDDLSGIDGSITTSGDLSAILGDYTITYTATDKAGNVATKTRKITVISSEFTVAFNANGGTGTMENQKFESNVAQNLFKNTFKKTGAKFAGWSTTPSGSAVYSDKQSISNLGTGGSTVILYAIWDEITGPVLAAGNTWYKKSEKYWDNLTEIYFVDSGIPSTYDYSWNADEGDTGSIKAYLNTDDDILTIVGDGSGHIIANPDSSYMFSIRYLDPEGDYSGNNIKILNTDILYTGYVENFEHAFDNTFNASTTTTNNIDLSHWDTSSVTNMRAMFDTAGIVPKGIENWDTSSVTDMNRMFVDGKTFRSVNLSDWDTSSVTDMDYMFGSFEPKGFSLNLSGWSFADDCSFDGMFSMTEGPFSSLNLNGWDTSNVGTMKKMFFYFEGVSSGILDLSDFTITENNNVTSFIEDPVNINSIILGPKVTGLYYSSGYGPFSGWTEDMTIYVQGKSSEADFDYLRNKYWTSGATVIYQP